MPRFVRSSFLGRRLVAAPAASLVGAGLLAAMAGCGGGPSRVVPPSISASGAASEAMKTYDKDGDGFIAGPELDAASGLKASMETLDLDKDGKVSRDEIVKRIESWQATGLGVMSISIQVKLDGRPLEGAKITFEPEPFLGKNVKTGVGDTASGGLGNVSVPKEDRPAADYPPGMQFGFFKVKISKEANGAETVPAQFNSETILGQQVSTDDPQIMSQLIKFDLKSK